MSQVNQFSNHPLFQRAQQMLSGKSPEQMRQVIMNVAKNRGISEQQLSEMLSSFGITL